MAGESDIDRAVAAAQGALAGDWGRTPPTERSRLLHALADAIVANRKELAELESRNVGKAISSVKAELAGATENFRYYASAIASIGGRSNPIGGSLLFYSQKEPVGVVGEIMRLCSDPIKRVTLELGGKSPNLLFADANLADAIPASVWAIYYAAGQSCEARSRLLVEQRLYDDVVAEVTDLAQKVKVGDPL